MSMTIHVDIVSQEREIFSGLAQMVFAPAIMGEVGIAPQHAPLVTRLAPGVVRVKLTDGMEASFYVSGGILEVQPYVVTILSDTAVRAEDLDEAAVLKAKEQAEKDLRNRETLTDYAIAQTQLAETVAQLRAIQRSRKRAGHS